MPDLSNPPIVLVNSSERPPKPARSHSAIRGAQLATITCAGGAGTSATITGAVTVDAIVTSRADATSSFSNALTLLYSPGWSRVHRPRKFGSEHTSHTPERTTADDAELKPFPSRFSIGLCSVTV